MSRCSAPEAVDGWDCENVALPPSSKNVSEAELDVAAVVPPSCRSRRCGGVVPGMRGAGREREPDEGDPGGGPDRPAGRAEPPPGLRDAGSVLHGSSFRAGA